METRRITIPARDEHAGLDKVTVEVPWKCLICGGPRGEPTIRLSYDGSRTMAVHGWDNPCGHVEKYDTVRAAVLDGVGEVV